MSEKLKIFYTITFWMTLLGIITFLVDFGFAHSDRSQDFFDNAYFVVLGMSVVATIVRYIDTFHLLQLFIVKIGQYAGKEGSALESVAENDQPSLPAYFKRVISKSRMNLLLQSSCTAVHAVIRSNYCITLRVVPSL